MARWYQNVPVEGAEYEGQERERSRFWNVGKWDNFIAPLLPRERRTFIDIGCNAGLMLKLAQDAGFEKVIGIEASKRAMQQAEQYRESVGGDWTVVLHRRIREGVPTRWQGLL
jgi:SAM-dependent methyltransferase